MDTGQSEFPEVTSTQYYRTDANPSFAQNASMVCATNGLGETRAFLPTGYISTNGKGFPGYGGYGSAPTQNFEVFPNDRLSKLLGTEKGAGMTRVVDIYICDPDPDVPLGERVFDVRLLFPTETTNNEDLLYDIGFNEILNNHNQARAKIFKKVDGKKVSLSPVKPSQLKVHVQERFRF